MFRHLLRSLSSGLAAPLVDGVTVNTPASALRWPSNRCFRTTTIRPADGDDDDANKGVKAGESPQTGDGDESGKSEEPRTRMNPALLPFNTQTEPEKLDLAYYKKRAIMLRAQSVNRKVQVELLSHEEVQGTIGASSLIAISSAQLDRYLPTLDTLKQLFDGVPFDELHIVHIGAKYNNTIVTCIDHKGNTVMRTSTGMEGFKNAQMKTVLAGQATGAGAARKLIRRGVTTVRVVVKGLGPGRMTAVQALAVGGINVVSITDLTRLPELGPRPRKVRRV